MRPFEILWEKPLMTVETAVRIYGDGTSHGGGGAI